MKKLVVRLHDGSLCSGDLFEEEDFLRLKEIFVDWQNINSKLKPLGGTN